MRNAETLKSSDSPAPKPAAAGRRFLPLALGLLAAAFSFTPTPVHADTPLPQGWTSDSDDGDAQADANLDVKPTQATVDATVTVAADEYVDTDPTALSDFRDPLTPYGVWADDPTYGTVWVPNGTVVGSDFAPYQTAGHWELDANGDWMWVSDYDWGYIPFHYGRWVYIGGRGWSWIPGRTYAPAWVTWRLTDYGYIGWAPMAPSWYWFGGSAVNVWVTPSSAYVFCPSSYVFHHHVHTYVVRDRDIVQRIGAHSRPYRPAQPTAGAGGASARPYKPASPSLAEAKVPSGSAPQVRGAPDARAVAYSRRSTTAQARTMSREAARNLPSHVASAPSHPEGRPMPAERAERGATHLTVPGQTSHHSDKPASVPERQTSRPAETHVTQPSAPSRVTTTPSRPSTTTSRPSSPPSRPSTTTSRPSSPPSRPSFSPPPSRPSSPPSRPSFSPSRPSFSPSRPSHRR